MGCEEGRGGKLFYYSSSGLFYNVVDMAFFSEIEGEEEGGGALTKDVNFIENWF